MLCSHSNSQHTKCRKYLIPNVMRVPNTKVAMCQGSSQDFFVIIHLNSILKHVESSFGGKLGHIWGGDFIFFSNFKREKTFMTKESISRVLLLPQLGLVLTMMKDLIEGDVKEIFKPGDKTYLPSTFRFKVASPTDVVL